MESSRQIFSGALTRTRARQAICRQAVMTVVGACPSPLSSDGITPWPSAQRKQSEQIKMVACLAVVSLQP